MFKRLLNIIKVNKINKTDDIIDNTFSHAKKEPVTIINKNTAYDLKKQKNDFSRLQVAILNWIPSSTVSEKREYQNELIRHLAPKFDKVVAGKGKYKADILINDILPIEIKQNLNSEKEYDLTCDFIEHYLDTFGKAAFVLVGNVNLTYNNKLKIKYKNQDVAIIKKSR